MRSKMPVRVIFIIALTIFIHSRPQNYALQGADGAWPLSISLQETAGFSALGGSPRSFIFTSSAYAAISSRGLRFCLRVPLIFNAGKWPSSVTESEIKEIRRELARETREVVVIGGGSGTNFFSMPIEILGWQRISMLSPFDTGGRTGKIKTYAASLSKGKIDFIAVGDITKVICRQIPLEAIKKVMDARIAKGEAGPDSSKNFTAKIKEILNDVLLNKISGTDTAQFKEHFVAPIIEMAKKVDDIFEGFDISGHSPRHLIFATLILYKTEREHKGYQRSIEEGTNEFLELVGMKKENANVFLSSVDKDIGKLIAEMEGREKIKGQLEITERDRGAISSISVEPIPEANIEAIKKLGSLQRGDMIIIGPGSFYTSIMVNMLPIGMTTAIKEARGKGVICIFVLNPIFENETIAMKSRDEGVFVHMLERVREHAGVNSIGELFDYIVANDFRCNSGEVAQLVTKEGSIEGDKKFERPDKIRLGGIGHDNGQEIPMLIGYLKKQPLGVSLVTGNLLEVMHTSPKAKEATFSPGKFKNILKAISQDHALSMIPEMIVISDPHATIDALAKIKKSLPLRDVFAVGDLMDRGDELWGLMRLVDRFVLGDHEVWAMGAGLGHDYLLALWIRSLYRYPETVKILKELDIDTGNFVEFANRYYDGKKLKDTAREKGDKYKGPKTPEEQAMFNIWIKLALQENDVDTMKAVIVKDASGNIVRRNILLNIKLGNEEKMVLDQVEAKGG